MMTVALTGNPNSGKTTVFNALTGLRQKVANYPGVTVEKKSGRCTLPDGRCCQVVDLPGTYSLISRSPDELVAMEVLRGLRDTANPPDVVVVVVDASNLQRNLYLVSQLIELGRPLVVALNMVDIAERRGRRVSAGFLEAELGVPVVPIVGHKGRGMDELKHAITHARIAPMPDWPLPHAMKEEVVLVGGGLAILDSNRSGPRSRASALGGDLDGPAANPDPQRLLDRYCAVAERLLIGDRASDLAAIAAREPVASLLLSAEARLHELGIEPMQANIEGHYRWIEELARRHAAVSEEPASGGDSRCGCPSAPGTQRLSRTDRIDSLLIHRRWGLVIFTFIMAVLFVAVFYLAAPITDAIRVAVHWLGHAVSARLPVGPIKDLVSDGIFGGVGSVVVFVPQIAILFLFLAVLEDSGYLARAAFLMDRILAKIGLQGRSFVPLLSSFACAIPGIMATRTIADRRSRLATILVAPFMSCSARLPVYSLLIGAFFASRGSLFQAGIMLSLYMLGMLAAVVVATVFKRSRREGPASAFMLEMPSYKLPQPGHVARQVYLNTREFITKAGSTIFCMSVVLWAISYYPRLPAERAAGFGSEKALGSARLDYSLAGRLGHAMQPLLRPLGYDWKIGVGLVGAFSAREVFVSTMGIVYSAGDPSGQQADLGTLMKADVYPDGRHVWTPLVGVSLLVWFVLAMQCTSTLIVVRRETGGWRWPVFMLVYMNCLAYVVCLAIYQVGSRLL